MNDILQVENDLLELLQARERELRYNKKKNWFPNEGPYRRDLYPAHIKFINASLNHSQLAFIAANRTGKTETGAYIMACHLTGEYPEWWKGKRFLNPINAWAAGKTSQKTKEILQLALIGPDNDIGSGMIPKEAILKVSKKPGFVNAVETIEVKHVTGGISILAFKSYEQGRDGFEGTKQQVIWLDEEPKEPSIYSECIMRLADPIRPGIMICTFTPLYGLSSVAMKFLPHRVASKDGLVPDQPDLFVVQCTWDDVPHLTIEDKNRLWNACLPHERDARSKGIPSLGSGAIYPYLEEDFVVEPFKIPDYWPKAYGLDTGWKKTAVIWGAQDPDTGILYLYAEYYSGREIPEIHAMNIKRHEGNGKNWMMGASDPAGANPTDGKSIFDEYVLTGLNLIKADKRNKEGAILRVTQLFESDQIKVFSTLKNWLDEFNVYRRDEDGKIIKEKDHLMDATQYLITHFEDIKRLPYDPDEYEDFNSGDYERDDITGY